MKPTRWCKSCGDEEAAPRRQVCEEVCYGNSMTTRSRSVAYRLETHRMVTPEGCWVWTRSITTSGYGQMMVDGRMLYVHRVAFEFYVGPIPEGHQVDHLCGVKMCFRPEHLEPVTQRENIERSGVRWAEFRRGRCHAGHDTTDPANVYTRPDGGGRMCRQCQRDRAARYREEARRARATSL